MCRYPTHGHLLDSDDITAIKIYRYGVIYKIYGEKIRSEREREIDRMREIEIEREREKETLQTGPEHRERRCERPPCDPSG